ncbi:hypothetical protein CONLIGDRAFT_687658 [Coniochaeta ligniaria NRRL 30616]|uniref:Uncharacterized protein n=1 Tax=Coniochaeta ligniaria NRRL 30616 TaxID=1408157 RepID=A0A1J7IXK5_9PEZI|nr:hypothetical protein CONLIGDRAFT_687658 [Coniochaeta ligniaria NRRL 30616]
MPASFPYMEEVPISQDRAQEHLPHASIPLFFFFCSSIPNDTSVMTPQVHHSKQHHALHFNILHLNSAHCLRSHRIAALSPILRHGGCQTRFQGRICIDICAYRAHTYAPRTTALTRKPIAPRAGALRGDPPSQLAGRDWAGIPQDLGSRQGKKVEGKKTILPLSTATICPPSSENRTKERLQASKNLVLTARINIDIDFIWKQPQIPNWPNIASRMRAIVNPIWDKLSAPFSAQIHLRCKWRKLILAWRTLLPQYHGPMVDRIPAFHVRSFTED